MISAAVGLVLVIGTTAIFTVLLGPSPSMIPFVVGMWLGIIPAITFVVKNYNAIANELPGA